MYALVEYPIDSTTVILECSEIQGFTPKNVVDFDAEYSYHAYWCGDDDTLGGYYEATIHHLSEYPLADSMAIVTNYSCGPLDAAAWDMGTVVEDQLDGSHKNVTFSSDGGEDVDVSSGTEVVSPGIERISGEFHKGHSGFEKKWDGRPIEKVFGSFGRMGTMYEEAIEISEAEGEESAEAHVSAMQSADDNTAAEENTIHQPAEVLCESDHVDASFESMDTDEEQCTSQCGYEMLSDTEDVDPPGNNENDGAEEHAGELPAASDDFADYFKKLSEDTS
ncbi:hypothetical protein HPB50_015361 [Hyalomma asiaticum]|uniref:Uncharacterized protein n=1 Tax=Hyalomma asiaticum TaxID=266040 RepID=A0ACB7RUM0_HYAAI|nr:hypothetical protein HPB50_015361 [Hyalomma asiaticum]